MNYNLNFINMDLLVKVVKALCIKIYYVPIEIVKYIIKELRYSEN